MRLFLIRHGETVDNVAGIYAGTINSALTNHGVLQANRLGQYLATTDVKVSHIFSSDLQRAFKTAEAIRLGQALQSEADPAIAKETKQLALLREQDFGFYEGKTFYERPSISKKSGKEAHLEAHRDDPGFVDVESKESMRARMDTFVDDNLVPLFGTVLDDHAITIVAHGIILAYLWRCILARFPANSVSVASGIIGADRGLTLEYLGGWSNTGYLELEIKHAVIKTQESNVVASATAQDPIAAAAFKDSLPLPASKLPHVEASGSAMMSPRPSVIELPSVTSTFEAPVVPPSKFLDRLLVVKAVNSLEHLNGLKKTRGGIGSSKHDEGQNTIESFFKKRKIG